jgi:fermentation-respiration switch protein FrsA (DUF1100 family)
MIIQGTNDIQISTDDANTLYAKSQNGQLLVIENMNHVLKIVPGDKAANIQSYSNPSLPLSTQLVDGIVQFVQKL